MRMYVWEPTASHNDIQESIVIKVHERCTPTPATICYTGLTNKQVSK